MLAYTYMEKGVFELKEKSKPMLKEGQDAIVKVTLASICASDLHIKYGSVPKAVPGITVGHEMVGVVESIGTEVTAVKPGDRVTVNVETFCGHCFFLQAWLCQQLHRFTGRLVSWLPYRWRTSRIRAGSLCKSGINRHTR